MTENFEEKIRNLDKDAGAAQKELDDLITFFSSPLPFDYVSLLKLSNGFSGHYNGSYLIFYSSKEVIELNRTYNTFRYSPGRAIFASNGGGTLFLLETGSFPCAAIYACEAVDLGREPYERVASSILDFLEVYGPEIG